MAPAKREFESMMFDYDPVFEIDVVLPDPRPAKRLKDVAAVDLTTYVVPSDDEFENVSAEELEFSVHDDLISVGVCKNPFFGSSDGRVNIDGADLLSSTESAVLESDLSGDLSCSDDDNGYQSMFNSPAHVLDSQYDVPFIDSMVSDAAESILSRTESDIPTLDDVVKAFTEPLPSATAAPLVVDAAAKPSASKVGDEAPPPQQNGKPPVNPTRWAHNSTERKRRLEIRKLFSGLRDLFPDIAGDDKISNITTLNRAIEHVSHLNTQTHQQEAAFVAAREQNAILRARAEECNALRKVIAERQEAALADVPPTALAVLEGSPDPELRKTLPAALRQLLDHNGRGSVEQKPLSRRRPKTSSLPAAIVV
jgi:hypothetical protein